MINHKIMPITTCDVNTFLNKLCENNQYNTSKIIKALRVAEEAHKGQFRKSGEPYIIHPICVSMILLELGMDTDTICAGLLHDVVEDTDVTLDDLRKQFGLKVAILVDSVTKIGQLPNLKVALTKDEQLAENVRKMVFATACDVRVIIVKLADRLHNMRTLEYRSPNGQLRTARETMNIFVPIAHRLGIYTIKNELEQLSFKYLDPFAYKQIDDLLECDRVGRDKFIQKIQQDILEEFKKYPQYEFLKKVSLEGRVKSIYGIYKKMFLKHIDFHQIYDKYAVRIITDTKEECYLIFGIIHDLFNPLPDRIKDYIANPKNNGYQSLHTTVVGKEGVPFEVQIRTWDMHKDAEYGVAAHWKYKENIKVKDPASDKRIAWFRNIMEFQQSCDDVEGIVDLIKDERNESIIALTPKGDVITMPKGSTVIDFAYKIHTKVGHRAIGAKVNGSIVPLEYEIRNSDMVEILTSKDENKGPNRAWLNIVTTNDAKSKIRSWFKRERREENILQGKEIVEREFRRNHMDVAEDKMVEFLSDDFKRYNCETIEDYYASIGYGGIVISKIMPRLKNKYDRLYNSSLSTDERNQPNRKDNSNKSHGIVFDNGLDDCDVKISQCCNPMPGDDIMGFITRGKGVSIHKVTCPNYKSALKKGVDMERWIKAHWVESKLEYFQVNIEVVATDRIGFVYDVTSILTKCRIMIKHSNSGVLKNKNAIFRANIFIASADQLNSIFDKIRKVKGVISVYRV